MHILYVCFVSFSQQCFPSKLDSIVTPISIESSGSLLATAVKDVGGSSGLLIMQVAALLIIAGMEPWLLKL